MNYLIDPLDPVHQAYWRGLFETAERSRRGRSNSAARRRAAAVYAILGPFRTRTLVGAR